MTVSGELCCVALPFCCVVVVALPFSASLEGLFMCTYTYIGMTVSLSCLYSNIVVCTHVYCSVDKCVHISVSAYHIYIYIYICVCVCAYIVSDTGIGMSRTCTQEYNTTILHY